MNYNFTFYVQNAVANEAKTLTRYRNSFVFMQIENISFRNECTPTRCDRYPLAMRRNAKKYISNTGICWIDSLAVGIVRHGV